MTIAVFALATLLACASTLTHKWAAKATAIIVGINAALAILAGLALSEQSAREVSTILDLFSAIGCVVIWLCEGCIWPLGMCALYTTQISVHVWLAEGEVTYQRSLVTAYVLNAISALQLALLVIGPRVRDGVAAVLRMLRRSRRYHRCAPVAAREKA